MFQYPENSNMGKMHLNGCSMKKPTKKQLEVMVCAAPPPIGYGMTHKEISQLLGISNVGGRISSLKQGNPEVYHIWKSMLQSYHRQKTNLRRFMRGEWWVTVSLNPKYERNLVIKEKW